MHVGRLSYSAPFFDNAARLIWQHFGHDACTWRTTLVLAPSIRTCSALRDALINFMPRPAFCPRIISFKNVPEYLGMDPVEVWSTEKQVAHLFAILDTPSPFKRLEQAKSWQRQMDEVSRHASSLLDEIAFERIFRPLWPGDWTDTLFEMYRQSAPTQLRQQTEELLQTWQYTPPSYPVVVVGSTGSTIVSRGWRNWVNQHKQGLIVERDDVEDTLGHVRVVQAMHAYQATRWIAQEVASHANTHERLAIVAHQPSDALNHQLAAQGLAVTYGEYVPFRNTPSGQFWACFMRLLAEEQPSTLLFWECLKKIHTDSEPLVEAELQCRRDKVIIAPPYNDIWENIHQRPQVASLTQWWAWLKGCIKQFQSISSHHILDDILAWPDEITVPNVLHMPAILLPHVDTWWPIPKYQVTYEDEPRVLGVGPWEARGMSCNHIWVYGLNEGTWPGQPDIEPWLSSLEREALGLPDAQHFYKLAYHDLMCTLGAAEHVTWVTLADQPLCRWLVNMPIEQLHDSVLAVKKNSLPPVGFMASPITSISVTEAERLMRDPYAYYVRSTLKLQELEPLPQLARQERTARDKGLIFHNVMNQWALHSDSSKWEGLLDERDVAEFFWKHQLEACLPHVKRGHEMLCEVGYALDVDGVRLAGRLDRIDIDPFVVINYKTGTLPQLDDIINGRHPQLLLETLLAAYHHKKDNGMSALMSLKHTPDTREWSWGAHDLFNIGQAFAHWIKSLSSYPAYDGYGMKHIERTAMWR